MIKKENVYYCDFCGKSQHDSAYTVAGDDGVAICDECIDIAADIVKHQREGWKAWNGGECPVNEDQRVDIIYRNRDAIRNYGVAGRFSWAHKGLPGDIVYYK